MRDNGIEPFIIEYLKNSPTIDEFKALSVKLGMRPMEFVRKSEMDFKNNDLKKKLEDDKAMFKAMNQYPKIMERPIVVKGDQAVLGRPPENILNLL